MTIAAVGDVMLGRSIGQVIEHDGPATIFADVRTSLAGADIAVANLECAVGDGGTPEPKAYTFLAPPGAVAALVDSGIDIVGLANNHALDFGPDTLRREIALLDAAGMAHAGAGVDVRGARAPAILTRNGLRVAFIAYVDVPVEFGGFDTHSWVATVDSPGVAWLDLDAMRGDIRLARTSADLVVVLLHFGLEREAAPSSKQVEDAHAAIDAGAALVIGAHPHVLQPVERYGAGLIAYSLGNFVFDGEESGVASEILDVTLDESGVVAWRTEPIAVGPNGRPAKR